MIFLFYWLYVVITPADWQWKWFLIAFMMQILTLIINAQREYTPSSNDNNYWKGGPTA
jgi:hypothetical protein